MSFLCLKLVLCSNLLASLLEVWFSSPLCLSLLLLCSYSPLSALLFYSFFLPSFLSLSLSFPLSFSHSPSLFVFIVSLLFLKPHISRLYWIPVMLKLCPLFLFSPPTLLPLFPHPQSLPPPLSKLHPIKNIICPANFFPIVDSKMSRM